MPAEARAGARNEKPRGPAKRSMTMPGEKRTSGRRPSPSDARRWKDDERKHAPRPGRPLQRRSTRDARLVQAGDESGASRAKMPAELGRRQEITRPLRRPRAPKPRQARSCQQCRGMRINRAVARSTRQLVAKGRRRITKGLDSGAHARRPAQPAGPPSVPGAGRCGQFEAERGDSSR